MKIIVTGGAGFIGSHLVESLLRKKHKVIILDNLSNGNIENIKHVKKNITFKKCDLSKKGNWDKYFKNADVIYHLAALADIVPSITDPDQYFNANVQSTLNILMAMKKYNVKKIIYSASSSCYGIPKNYPTSEDAKIDPQYPYAFTKWVAEEMIIHWSKIYKLKYISLRLFNVYGPRSRTSGTYGAVFGVFMAQKINNLPYTIVGDGTQTRDFTFVTDVVEAMVQALNTKLKCQVYNVGSGKTVSINKIVKLLGGSKTYIPERPGEPNCTFAEIKKIKKDLKWKPNIDINKGIKIMLNDINYWKNAPKWTPDKIKKSTKNWFKYLNEK